MTGLTFKGDGLLQRFSNQLGVLGAQAPVALARALNHTGAKAKTQVVNALTKQTGLKRSTILRTVKVQGARHGNEQFAVRNTDRLTYVLSTSGGDISLKYFDPKETREGVTAKPRGRRQLFAATFIKSGRFPNRVGPYLGGHVYANIAAGHAWTGKAKLQNSGVSIPEEMLQGETAAAFERVMSTQLEERVSKEIEWLMQMPGL